MARRKTLTDASIAALKPRPKRFAIPDDQLPSFYVRVMPTGAKSFCAVATDPSGKQHWKTIGPTHLYGVEEARTKAREIIKAIRAGEGGGPETFMSVAGQWLKQHVHKNGLRSRAEIERLLAKYLFPRLAGRDFASIRRSDLATVFDEIENQHGGRQADCCLTVFQSIATWYARRNDAYASPIIKGMRRASGKAHERTRILSDAEIRQLWAALPLGDTFGDLTKLLLLTAQRREKVVTMRWDAIEDGVWTIPSGDREKGNAGSLRLPKLALDVLAARPRFASNPHVFAASRGKGHASGFSQWKAQLDSKHLRFDEPWTLHDLRRTARSLMSRAGVSSEHAERVLGHAIAGVEGIYDRHRYHDEKAEALAKLAGLISRILEPESSVRKLRA
jgi:integrase